MRKGGRRRIGWNGELGVECPRKVFEMGNEPNKAERDAVPAFVANACQCQICGGPADRSEQIFQCQTNPGHLADTMTGIFSDHTKNAG